MNCATPEEIKQKAIKAINELNSDIVGIVQLIVSEKGENSVLVGGMLPIVTFQIKKAMESNPFIKNAFKLALELADKNEEEDEEEEDEESSNDIFESMSRSELKSFIKKYALNIKVYKSMSDDDIRQAIRNRFEDIK